MTLPLDVLQIEFSTQVLNTKMLAEALISQIRLTFYFRFVSFVFQSQSKQALELEPTRALDPLRWPKRSKLWERVWVKAR